MSYPYIEALCANLPAGRGEILKRSDRSRVMQDMDPNALTILQLRSYLSKHGIEVPARRVPKKHLIALFSQAEREGKFDLAEEEEEDQDDGFASITNAASTWKRHEPHAGRGPPETSDSKANVEHEPWAASASESGSDFELIPRRAQPLTPESSTQRKRPRNVRKVMEPQYRVEGAESDDAASSGTEESASQAIQSYRMRQSEYLRRRLAAWEAYKRQRRSRTRRQVLAAIVAVVFVIFLTLSFKLVLVPYCDTGEENATSCAPCPEYGICRGGSIIGCRDGKVLRKNPFLPSLPLVMFPVCEPDWRRQSRIDKLAGGFADEVRTRAGLRECRERGFDDVSDYSEADLRERVQETLAPMRLSESEFETHFELVLRDLEKRLAPDGHKLIRIHMTEGGQRTFHTSYPHLPLMCHIKNEVRTWIWATIKENQALLAGILSTAMTALAILMWRKRRIQIEEDARSMAIMVLKQLIRRDRAHLRNTSIKPAVLVIQLRDSVGGAKNAKAWKKAQQKVLSHSCVRQSMTTHRGTQQLVWEYTGERVPEDKEGSVARNMMGDVASPSADWLTDTE